MSVFFDLNKDILGDTQSVRGLEPVEARLGSLANRCEERRKFQVERFLLLDGQRFKANLGFKGNFRH